MPISLQWDDDAKTILRFTFWNEWLLSEYVWFYRQAVELMGEVTHHVDLLVDLRTGSFVPKGNTVKAFRYMVDRLPENAGIMVYIADDAVQRHLVQAHIGFYNLIRPRLQRRLFMVNTPQQAYDCIAEHRLARQSNT